MLRISIIIEELIEGNFHTIDSAHRAVLTKEDAIKVLNIEYLRAKKFLEDNWHNGDSGS